MQNCIDKLAILFRKTLLKRFLSQYCISMLILQALIGETNYIKSYFKNRMWWEED